MKKLLLSAIALFAFGAANAQEVKFGPKVALNYSTLSLNGEQLKGYDVSGKIGFQIGGFAEIKLSDKFSVQPELLYSLQGATTDFSYNIGLFDKNSTKATINLNYLLIPIMGKFYATEALSFEVGPQLGFLLSQKNTSEFTTTTTKPGSPVVVTQTETSESTSKDEFNTFDFGINVGAGYDITEKLVLGLRYNLALTNINKTVSGDDSSLKNRNLSLSVAYKF